MVATTESEDRVDKSGVVPWYYEQLARIYRKNKDLVKEHAILERFESQRHAPGRKPETLMARLAKGTESLQAP